MIPESPAANRPVLAFNPQIDKDMKESCKLTLVGASLLLAAASSHAQCTNECSILSKFYVGVDAGGAIQQDISIHQSPFGNSGRLDYNPGVRGNLYAGYNWFPCFATELETGTIWTSIHSIDGNSGGAANQYAVPFLANFIYKPLHGAFQPYIGVGCGGVFSMFDTSNNSLLGTSFNGSDVTFAYQGEVGFKYSLSQHVQLGLGYQFLGTTDHDWSDHGTYIKTAGNMTHSIVASFTWCF